LKAQNARNAGAVGAIIYNNLAGRIAGLTLGTDFSNGQPAPTLGISREDGLAIRALLNDGITVNGVLSVQTVIQDAITYVRVSN
jgi:carboxypeptidase Q